ncbi:helix-turn-helix domain-containing protein [Nocardioides sp. MJB4]|uniref:Helix-turn-helix domain-containing protein n=2 Tax=Nocardioides donggukensis TaxID=2774019 RepID=A0A927Q1D1_9ACTN|nr:helix-turn-helix domain-containing protein [Nocardioides donggukensis]
MARMDSDKEWFRDLSAQDRSWVGMIVQAGIQGFIHWYRDHAESWTLSTETDSAIAAEVFGAAPRALAGVINLQQTVELVRLTIDVVEENLDELLGPDLVAWVHEGLLRYGRELAFATAEVYARAAEVRGAWDARLEALVVDAVLRSDTDDSVLSRASALGWGGEGDVVVVLGAASDAPRVTVFDDVRGSAQAAGMDALCAVQGDLMVVVLGNVSDPGRAASRVEQHFAAGPLVHGPPAADLRAAHSSATAAMSAFRAAAAWPGAPRPVAADDLLPERALGGDAAARQQLIDEVYLPLREARGTLIETLDVWFAQGTSVEGTARQLFVHPNTVRYRLRQAADLTGLTPGQPRHAHTYAVALTLGRLAGLPTDE